MRTVSLVLFWSLSVFPAQAAHDRITDQVDRSQTALLERNVHPRALPQYDQGAVESSFALSHVTLTIKQSREQQAALEQLLEDQRDPSSQEYRNWLSPEEFGVRFGASQSDIGKLTSWLQSQDFAVDEVARGLNWISFSATAEQLDRAFGTAIHRYLVDGELHFANKKAPAIPAAFLPIIESIDGLTDFRLKPPRTNRLKVVPDYTSGGGSHYLTPDDLGLIYDLTPLKNAGFDGTGQKIVIAGQTDINLADIRAFRANFNLPAKDPQLVLYGRDPGTSSGDVVEADLDLEWAGATARNATIIYVYSTDVITSVQYAVNQSLAPVISLSYGGCEPYNSPSLRSLAQQANAEGITWVVASGDSGAASCEGSVKSATTGLAVSYPASIPEVTAVGGTEFAEGIGTYWSAMNGPNLGSALSYIPEMAWNDTALQGRIGATGGGASVFYKKPSWQTGPGVPNDNARDLPDVSLTASADHDGFLVYAGGLMVVGGTSASTPSFAGMLAILNQYLVSKGIQPKAGLGNINPALYHLAQTSPGVFHDITGGTNIVPCTIGTPNCTTGLFGYSAGPGYDLVTGLGSVDANNLVTHWSTISASISTTTSLGGSSLSLSNTATTQLTATVKPGSGSSAPSGSVTFATGVETLGTVAVSASGPNAIATLPVAGSKLLPGANKITASYGGDSSFSGSTGSITVAVPSSIVATTTGVVANPASTVSTAAIALTATIRSATGGAAPVGTITFASGGKSLGTAPLAASGPNGIGVLSVNASNLQAGANTVTAIYAGSAGFGASAGSVAVAVTNPPAIVSTTTKLLTSSVSIVSTGSTLLTASLSAASGSALPSGTISFSLSGAVIGTAQLVGAGSSATAILTVAGSKLKIGSNVITATYAATAAFGASSGTVAVNVTASISSAHVTGSVIPNPVYELHGGWTITIRLTETGGIPTKVTAFTINGTSYAGQIGLLFPTANIAANGTLSSSLELTNVPYPVTAPLSFSGVDPNGQQWTQSVPVTFQGSQTTTTSK